MTTTTDHAADLPLEDASTRPSVVTRRAAHPKRKVVRFTLDLDREQHQFLRLFALQNGVQASLVMRTLLYILETNLEIATRVIDEIYADQEDTVVEGAEATADGVE